MGLDTTAGSFWRYRNADYSSFRCDGHKMGAFTTIHFMG